MNPGAEILYIPYNLIYLVQLTGTSQDKQMPVTILAVLSLVGMGLVAALAAAVYASLPRSFLDSAERHGRFHGLQAQTPASTGTPVDAIPADATLGIQTA